MGESSGVDLSGQALEQSRAAPQPRFGSQAAWRSSLGPRRSPEQAGRAGGALGVAVWAAASEGTLTMLPGMP